MIRPGASTRQLAVAWFSACIGWACGTEEAGPSTSGTSGAGTESPVEGSGGQGSGGNSSGGASLGGQGGQSSEALESLLARGVELEKIFSTEEPADGPAWFAQAQTWVFGVKGTAYAWTGEGDPTPFVQGYPSFNPRAAAADFLVGVGAPSEGAAARLYTRGLGESPAQVFADEFEGGDLPSPNDLVVRTDGVAFFTNRKWLSAAQPEGGLGMVLRVTPAGQVTKVADGIANPNGIALAHDEQTLYVSASSYDAISQGALVALDVAANGDLSNPRQLTLVRRPDGMAVDAAGNLFVTAEGVEHSDAIEVFDSSGARLGGIQLPERATNCALGGVSGGTLLVTTNRGVYVAHLW